MLVLAVNHALARTRNLHGCGADEDRRIGGVCSGSRNRLSGCRCCTVVCPVMPSMDDRLAPCRKVQKRRSAEVQAGPKKPMRRRSAWGPTRSRPAACRGMWRLRLRKTERMAPRRIDAASDVLRDAVPVGCSIAIGRPSFRPCLTYTVVCHSLVVKYSASSFSAP
jgi:hypothetical protein